MATQNGRSEGPAHATSHARPDARELRRRFVADVAAARRVGDGGWVAAVATVRFLATALFRLAQLVGLSQPVLATGIKQLNHLLTGADLAWQADVGGGLVLFHPTGVVIGPGCRVGANCVMQQGITLGAALSATVRTDGSPTLGDNVFLGPGCRVIGELSVGSDTVIGANAVVTGDVPQGVTAKGVPARW